MTQYRRAFISNPVGRFDNDLLKFADEVVAVCPTPFFDSIVADEEMALAFKSKIDRVLDGFDEELDVILDYGDPLIFAMMVYYLADREFITIGRFNRKTGSYVFYTIDQWWQDPETVKDDEDDSDEEKTDERTGTKH